MCFRFKAVKVLREAGIPAEVILDAAIGHYMQTVDLVLVGAEGIVENGGLINQVLFKSINHSIINDRLVPLLWQSWHSPLTFPFMELLRVTSL